MSARWLPYNSLVRPKSGGNFAQPSECGSGVLISILREQRGGGTECKDGGGCGCRTSHNAKALSSLLDKTQRWTASLRRWWRRRGVDASSKQGLPYFLPYDIADPDGGDVACDQFDGVRSRPFALLGRPVGAQSGG